MSKLRLLVTFLVPLLVLATMALGLRLGAEPAGVAATVTALPIAAKGDRLFWQVRTIREERRIREVAPDVELSVKAHGPKQKVSVEWHGRTDDQGVAEAELAIPGVATGDPIDIEVSGVGVVLASGTVNVPAGERALKGEALRPTSAGHGYIHVYAPAGGIPPQLDSLLWVQTGTEHRKLDPPGTLVVKPESGIEIPGSTFSFTQEGCVGVPVRATGLTIAIRVESDTHVPSRPNDQWFGAIPVVPGGNAVTIEPPFPAPGAPFTVRVQSATTQKSVYLEITDEIGREGAMLVPIANFEARVPVAGLPEGLHFIVASTRPDGFGVGTSVARPFRVGARAPNSCAERDDAVMQPPIFARAPALDGFTLRRAEAAKIRKKGLLLAVGSLAVGGLLGALMLATLFKKTAPKIALDEADAEAITRSTTPRWMPVAILIALSSLAYFLLAALVLYRGG